MGDIFVWKVKVFLEIMETFLGQENFQKVKIFT